MKRILNCFASDFKATPTREELKEAIAGSEGRVVIAESVAVAPEFVSGLTNSEVVSSFGADLILLKRLNLLSPSIVNLENKNSESIITDLKTLTGRLIGINLEITDKIDGTTVNEQTVTQLNVLKPDFVCLTGYYNPKVVTQAAVLDAIKLIRSSYKGLIMVNRYNGMESFEKLTDMTEYLELVDCGADMIFVPAPGTIPGVGEELVHQAAVKLREKGALVTATISTSQEGADTQTLHNIALSSKRAFVDAYEFGDANTSGIAAPENIFTLSMAVRGRRHTLKRICGSINR